MYLQKNRARFMVTPGSGHGAGGLTELNQQAVQELMQKNQIHGIKPDAEGASVGSTNKASKRARRGKATLHEEGEGDDGGDPRGKKRVKREPSAASSSGSHDGDKIEDMVDWRINPDEFNERLKEDLCVDFIAARMDAESSEVFRAVMRVYRDKRHQATISCGTTSRSGVNPQVFTTNEVVAMLAEDSTIVQRHRQNEAREVVVKVLDSRLWGHPLLDIVKPLMADQHDGHKYNRSYLLNFRGLTEAMQMNKIESTIALKFDRKAVRIFRLLQDQKALEVKAIKDKAMLESMKEAHKLLYSLLRANYIHLYEVPKDTTHEPKRTFYLFYINRELLLDRFRADTYESVMKIHKQHVEAERKLSNFKDDLLHQIHSGELSTEECTALENRYNGVASSLLPKLQDLELTVMELEELIAIYNFSSPAD
mmetsp:Transcript_1083/g.2987  ORF Transcript_1083/g.2987 Transcript_1083/m.2987 type:complete len:424 (+) Transcript_1083:1-1272(+)